MKNNNVTLIVLDGYGLSNLNEGNAIKNAYTPNLDSYFENNPNTILHCSGLDVGLPEGQFGSSEVGHMNMGAGRVLYQNLPRITKSIQDGEFFYIKEFINAIENCKKHSSNLHIMGLLSDGGIHTHTSHLYALLELAKKEGFEDVYIHCFLDGRDTPVKSGRDYIKNLIEKLRTIGIGNIATISGRYYPMDRDNNWERTQTFYNAMFLGEGEKYDSAILAIEDYYNRNITDEFVIPTVIKKDNAPTSIVQENDSIIFFNFRADRARQLTKSIIDEDFSHFIRKKGYLKNHFVCMTEYDESFTNVSVAFKPEKISNNFGEYLSKMGYKQFRIAETQKYAHVTFFFNGGIEKPFKGEDRLLIKSSNVATFDEKPEMCAFEVTDEAIKKIKSNEYDFILINYANCDMVGHTGNYSAAISAVETIDKCVHKVVEAVKKTNGIVIITADHGNCEQMINESSNEIHTTHTTNVVPFIIIGKNVELKKGRLADIAPTILDIMNLPIPKEMTGESLIVAQQ